MNQLFMIILILILQYGYAQSGIANLQVKDSKSFKKLLHIDALDVQLA